MSISPWAELLIGYGVTPVHLMEQSGMLLTLSVDTLPLTGTADLWSVIRLTTGLLRGQAEQELAVSTRRILEMATIDAARSLGLGDVVGSLTPGKRADLILVRTRDVATAPQTDVPNLLALAAGAANVDTVMVDGRIRKQHGAAGRHRRRRGRDRDRDGPAGVAGQMTGFGGRGAKAATVRSGQSGRSVGCASRSTCSQVRPSSAEVYVRWALRTRARS